MNTQPISKTMFLLLLLAGSMYGCKNNTTGSQPGGSQPGGPQNKKEYAYLAGGMDGSGPYAETYEFDPTTKKWQEVTGGALPKEIGGAISFTLNGKAYLAGGAG